MSVIVLTFLSLTIASTFVIGEDCGCEYNLTRNNFYGDQECFVAYTNIAQTLREDDHNETFIRIHADTLCNGNCGAKLSRILYYQDRTSFFDRRNVS